MTEEEVTTKSNGEDKKESENLEEASELDQEIIRQVEYYFGDLNLPRDRFLREQVKLDNGWVPLTILTKFNRLSKLTNDTDVIAAALNKSTTGLLEVSEDNTKIRRCPDIALPEMNEERRKELMARTIYAKGFPVNATLDELLEFFKQFEEVENIIMRKYMDRKTKSKHFKGSIFATFKTKEQAQLFLETKGTKYGETELIIRWQEDYNNDKQEEYAARKEKKDKKGKDNDNKPEKEEFKLPTGTLLHFTNDDKEMTREDVKTALTPLGADIAYINFKVGDNEGWVRYAKEDQAKEVIEKITDGKLKIRTTELTFRLLEGDEEKEQLEKSIEEMVKRRKGQKNKQFKGKNKGRFGGRKRKQDQNDDGPPTKVKAAAD